jgi:hypothetical protein
MDKQEAIARLDAIEKEQKALRAIIEAPVIPEPRWKSHPEELVGKLCRVWTIVNINRMMLVTSISSECPYPFECANGERFTYAEPLTPAEIAAMTYRPTRYNWSKDIPDWANWMATDPDGSTHAFDYNPHIDNISHDEWMRTNDRGDDRHQTIIRANGNPCPDWRDSLEHRPESV